MKSETKLLQRFTGVGAAPYTAQSTLDVVATHSMSNSAKVHRYEQGKIGLQFFDM